ncbi:hypothetical protein [Mycobacterium sp.]|uniref:hypothetical protein n=1 Tax=Mycobacterium sp. TaxID=1785 RepID=UPI003F9B5CC9
MTALLDYSVAHRPRLTDGMLDVPIPELARIVIALYWRQTRPFDGCELRQSRLTRSRILDSVTALQAAAGGLDAHTTPAVAASVAPEAFGRAVDSVGIYLAQQPLPRIQRSPGLAKSVTFLYDDSFLHDNVSSSELQRHNNAIQLRPGVAAGLAAVESPLRSALQAMWTYDVLWINGISLHNDQRLATHLFGRALPENWERTRIPASSSEVPSSESDSLESEDGMATSSFAARLNRLFEVHRGPNGQQFSTGEVAAKIRQSGFPITVSTLTQLRYGGPPPAIGAITALAKFFGVRPSYFSSGGSVSAGDVAGPTPSRDHSPTVLQPDPDADAELSQTAGSLQKGLTEPGTPPLGDTSTLCANQSVHTETPGSSAIGDQDAWGVVVGADLNEVAAVCEIRSNGCWLARSNSGVRCRAKNDAREPLNLPKIALHRWAWMVDNDLTEKPIPSHLIQIRRQCSGATCCNPAHLYATQPGGAKLTRSEVASLFKVTDTRLGRRTADVGADSASQTGRVVLPDNVGAIYDYCVVDKGGCWIAPTASPVPCRADGDDRVDSDVPQLAFHRWTWMVVHGFSSNPLPGNLFQVRRYCGKSACCKPDHLYLAGPDGQELGLSEVEAWLQSGLAEGQEGRDMGLGTNTSRGGWRIVDSPPGPATEGGKHWAPASDDHQRFRDSTLEKRPTANSVKLFADRLNELFESHPEQNGVPYTSAEVAALLQEDGLAVSEVSIARLRAASGKLPNAQTIEALAYFFDVDIDYFSAGAHSTEVSDHIAAAVGRHATIGHSKASAVSPTPRVQVIPVAVTDLGRIVGVLSQVTSECIAGDHCEVERADRLLVLLNELGAILSTPRESFVVSRLLLRRIVTELMSAGGATNTHQALLARLTALLDKP